MAANGHEHTLLAGVFGEQRAVSGVNSGNGRRLVVCQLLIIGETPAEVVKHQQDPTRTGDGEQNQPGK